MQNFYFTFGSDSRFPYGRDDYVLVQADDLRAAIAAFRAVHPDRPGTNLVNCASYYTEEDFDRTCRKYYDNRDPIETIAITLTVTKGE